MINDPLLTRPHVPMGAAIRPAQDRLANLPIKPGDPGYYDRIPPPSPEMRPENANGAAPTTETPEPQEAAPVAPTTALAPTATQRVAIGFGPREGTFVMSVEAAPDWDVVEGSAVTVDRDTVLNIYPLLKTLARVKNSTGQKFDGA